MSYPHGRARVNATSPSAFAICDRCGFLYNHRNLHWQMDYRGRSLANLRILVCDTCEDTPQPQLKPRIIPPDPVSIPNARPERYRQYETNNRYTQGGSVDFWTGLPVAGGDQRTTENDYNRVTQQTGEPPYGLNITPGTHFTVPGNLDPGLPYDMTGVPETGFLPNVTYVVWNNDVYAPVTWTNDQSLVMTWEPTGYTPVNPPSSVSWLNNYANAQSWVNNNYVITFFTQG